MQFPISRRASLAALSGLLAGPLTAQQQVAYRDYSRCLPEFLRHIVGESVRTRNEAIGKLTTREAVTARQQWVRRTFWEIAGRMPERTALNLKTTGSFERAAYRVEKLTFESQPGLMVSANLYIPKSGTAPYPGVLFQLGHSLNGKAAIPYQKCCQGLVQLGFVVLAFDPMGQGERIYYPRRDSAATRLRSADDEHTVPGQQMLLVGMSSTQMQTWDAMRALDVLASHPLVDPKRLASTGNSGGGTTTMMLAAVDDRLAAAAPSCPNSENFAVEEFNAPGSTDDAEQNFPGSGPLGFDRWDMLYPMAPKPLLILVSGKDFFGTYSPRYITNGRQEFSRLQSVYRTLGKADQIAWWESPLPHGLHYSARMEIYRWFRRWLQDNRQPLTEEPAVAPEDDKTLLVSATGSVTRTRPVDMVRRAVPSALSEVPLKKLLGIEEIYERPRKVALGAVDSEGCKIESFEVSTATHVWSPCWLFRPTRASSSGEVLIVLDAAGRNARAGEGALCHQLAQRGIMVCAAELRGNGDVTPEAGRGATRYTIPHASEHDFAWASIILGQSLLGQRVVDLISVVRTLAPLKVKVAAQGKMAVPALMAAALEPAITGLYLAGGLASYRHVVETEEYREPFANFVPGILRHTDLPLIAAGLKGKLVIGGAVDGAGRALALEQAKSLYGKAQVFADSAWTVERLAAL